MLIIFIKFAMLVGYLQCWLDNLMYLKLRIFIRDNNNPLSKTGRFPCDQVFMIYKIRFQLV
ncbi:hypothetical protein OC25_17755 [Pedobacter kyungheensis]|uniref:Uncharacterized protein n=1 Tax=Pedobacter kyungheensis TaxID=1069985 RepID=A0A0C1FH13_9SPHI|nr:hypothetical protein OC25_17755 [Pedobacter kyungheensis]